MALSEEGAVRRAETAARRDPVRLLRDLIADKPMEPCSCPYVTALFTMMIAELRSRRTDGRFSMTKLLDEGIVRYMRSLITDPMPIHGPLRLGAVKGLADLCRVIGTDTRYQQPAIYAHFRDLVEPLVEQAHRALIATSFRPDLMPLGGHMPNDGLLPYAAMTIAYLRSKPFHETPQDTSDQAIRLIICASLQLGHQDGQLLDYMQALTRTRPTRLWDALSTVGEFAHDPSTRPSIVARLIEEVNEVTAMAKTRVHQGLVHHALCRIEYIVPIARGDAAALLMHHGFATSVATLFAACVTAHIRGGSDEEDACLALSSVGGLLTDVYTADQRGSSNDEDVRQIQCACLSNLELVAALAQHQCNCSAKTRYGAESVTRAGLTTTSGSLHGSLACLEAVVGLAERVPRARAIARERLGPLLAPMLHEEKARSPGQRRCGHLVGTVHKLATALDLSVGRRCANVECDVGETIGEAEGSTPQMMCCSRCQSLYVCASLLIARALIGQARSFVNERACAVGERVRADARSAHPRHRPTCAFLGYCRTLPVAPAHVSCGA